MNSPLSEPTKLVVSEVHHVSFSGPREIAALTVPMMVIMVCCVRCQLHPSIALTDISEVFTPFGEVVDLSMPTDPATSQARGPARDE